MNWYKKAQLDPNLLYELGRLDTRGKADKVKANEIILRALNIQIGDILRGVGGGGMSSGIDKNYKVLSINPDFSVNLFAMETKREMPNAALYDFIKHNMPRWEKV